MPFMRNIMLLVFPPEKRGLAMGLTGIVIALAPALGPTLSGWIVTNYSWRYLFGALLPVSVIVLVLAMLGMRKIIITSKPKLDILSVVYSTVGFGGILYGFATFSSNSLTISLLTIMLGIIAVALMITRQFKITPPMLDMKVFKSGTFTLTTILTSIGSMSLLGMQLLVPLFLQNALGISALTVGFIMLPGALVMGIVTPISGVLFDRYGIKKLAIIGFAIYTAALVAFLFISADTSIITITVLYMIWMAGISLMIMQLATAGVNTLPTEQIAHGNAINTMGQQVFAAISTAALISIASTITVNQTNLEQQAATLAGYHGSLIFLTITGILSLIGSFFLKSNKE